MSRPAHWALSPLGLQAHLLPLMVMRFAEVSARKCTDCHLISLSDAILALGRENPVRKGVRDDDDLVSAVWPGP